MKETARLFGDLREVEQGDVISGDLNVLLSDRKLAGAMISSFKANVLATVA